MPIIQQLKNFTVKKAAPVVKQVSGTATAAHDFETNGRNDVAAGDTINYSRTPLKIHDAAQQYLGWRLCPIPTMKGEKRPVGNWKEYQDRLPTEDEWKQWETEEHTAVGLVCGEVSGKLLVIDFDQQGKAFKDFKMKIPAILLRRLVIEQTPSGGYHIYVRSEQAVDGNKVLARDVDGEVLIETRGEGGFIVCDPSPGYTRIQGDFSDIPILSADKIELLLDAAGSFDKKATSEPKPRPVVSQCPDVCPPREGDTAFDWFAKSGEWRNHLGDLEERGWRFLHEKDGQLFFQTPDGDHGPGKHDGNIKDGVAYIFSRAPFPFTENQAYSTCRFFAGALFGDTDKAGLAKFAERYLGGFPKTRSNQGVVAGGELADDGNITQSNTGSNTQSNTDEIPEILEENGIFVTSVTFSSESNNKPETHHVMLSDNGKPIIVKTFRNQSNKSLTLRVVGGDKHYLTICLQGDTAFEWHSKTSVTSVDGKVTNWQKSFKSEDSYAYIRDDNPANPNEWEIDLGRRTIVHNTMSTPPFRTSTYEDVEPVTEEDCRWYWQQMKENRDGKYEGDWDYLENSLAYMVQGLYRKHGRPCTILMADDGSTAKKDLSVAIRNVISGVTRNSLDKLEPGKPGSVALFNSSIVIADESEDLSKADLGVLKNICDATFDTLRALYSNERTAEIRSLLIVMTNTLRIPLNRSYIRKLAYLGAGESKGGNNAEFDPEDEARFKRLSMSPRVHEYWYDHLMSLKVDVYKATTKYGTEHLQEDNMDDLLEELRLIESGRSDFFCISKECGIKERVKAGSTFKQIELKNYLLSRPDKTLLNGKKDIVKVLRGYIDRKQLNWTINERTSNLKNGAVKKQVISITAGPDTSGKHSYRQVIRLPQSPEAQRQHPDDLPKAANVAQ